MDEQGAGVGWMRRLGLVTIVAALLWVWMCQASRLRLVAPEDAPVASTLRLRSPDGEIIDLADLAGHVVVVNLWASWCGPCRDETPGLVRVYEEFREQGLRIVGVNVESLPPGELARIGEEWGIAYPVAVPAGSMSGTFSRRGVLPYSWVIDRAGRVRASHAGYLLESSLRSAVRRLLDES